MNMGRWFRGWPVVKGGPVVDKGGPGSGFRGHAGRPGQRGGSAPRGISASYFETGAGAIMIEGLTEKQQRIVIRSLMHKNVLPEHLGGIRRITTEPPTNRPDWKVPAENSPTGEVLEAAGHYEDGVLRVNPNTIDFGFTFQHELGHHVTTASDWRKSDVGTSGARILLGKFRDRKGTPTQTRLASMGLRDYSFGNAKEFMADCWRVYHLGRRVHRTALAKYLGVEDLGKVFGR